MVKLHALIECVSSGDGRIAKVDGSVPTQDELEHLFVNNVSFSRVEAYLNRFNPIRVMRMQDMEIRHSAILAWLLDPRETHGLGDEFLRCFLAEAMRGQSALGSPTAIEIYEADLRDAEVRREWQNIDIFVLLPRLNWAFVIENKYYSSQSEGQLSTYSRRVKDAFEARDVELKVRGIFLTLQDEEPQDASCAPIRYSVICDFLPDLMKRFGHSIREDVNHFIEQYIEVIKEAAGMSNELAEMEKLAKQLYRSHKKALDFVLENGRTTEFVIATESVFGEELDDWPTVEIDQSKYLVTGSNSVLIQFLPDEWVKKLGGMKYSWPGCENWWAGYPLICWIQLYEGSDAKSGNLWLYAEVGPIENYEFRKSLITRMKEVSEAEGVKSVRFQKGAADEGKRYSKFLKDNNVVIQDIHDSEQIERGIRLLLKRFVGVSECIGQVLHEFEQFGVQVDA